MQINVTVKYIGYSSKSANGKSYWLILNTDLGCCKGNMYWIPKQNESLTLVGDWGEYKGQKEFKFKSAAPNIPVDSRAQLNYICKITSGIGEVLENKIWNELGEDWQKIEEGDVKGMTGRKLAEFRLSMEQLKTNIDQVNTISFLISKGATFTMANAAWEEWEKETIGIVQADCFRLTDLPHYGFANIDSGIRQNFGISDNDPRRLRAGILYAMKQVLSDGSTISEWELLQEKASEILKTTKNLILTETANMLREKTLTGFNRDGGLIATTYDYNNEFLIWEFAQDVGA